MTLDEFDAALSALGWKVSEFCRATGLHRNTPSRWRNEGVEIPAWVPQHLGLLLDLKRLQAAHVVPPSPRAGGWYLQDLQRLPLVWSSPPPLHLKKAARAWMRKALSAGNRLS